MNLTSYQIWKRVRDMKPLEARRAIYRIYREQDTSHLWPVSGRFNVTERAIRRLRSFERDSGKLDPREICEWLERDMSLIVNGRV